MKVKKITISKKHLDLIPEPERILLIQIGHLKNELSTFHKLLIFAHTSYRKSGSDIEEIVHSSQILIIARVYIGKLFEGWRMLEENFFGTRLSREYEPLLSKEGSQALQNLKCYFGKENLFNKIRNEFSFHFPKPDAIKQQLNMFDESAEFSFFVAHEIANSHFAMSEEVVSRAMLNQTTETTSFREQLDKVFQDLTEVGKWFIDFTGHCFAAILDKNFEPAQLNIEEIEIDEPPKLDEITIPFFVGFEKYSDFSCS